MIQFLKLCIKEIQDFPEENREDISDTQSAIGRRTSLRFSFAPSNAVDW